MCNVRREALWSFFALAVVVGIIHNTAMAHYWYWTYWWMDVLMHFLGGAVIGMGALWLLSAFGVGMPLRGIFLITVGAALVVGLGWELFETIAGYFKFEEPFPDTFFDLFSDFAGGMFAYVYAHVAGLIHKECKEDV